MDWRQVRRDERRHIERSEDLRQRRRFIVPFMIKDDAEPLIDPVVQFNVWLDERHNR